jgi:hypothetical protein
MRASNRATCTTTLPMSMTMRTRPTFSQVRSPGNVRSLLARGQGRMRVWGQAKIIFCNNNK